MSPTVRDHVALVDRSVARGPHEPRRAVVYAWSVLAVALVLVVALLARGEALPAPGPLLLLAVPLALCMNRYLFFPNEIGVTADAAVLFAAIVAFGGDAPWLGPLVLALLVGPLDARHWGARAWSRMAYNSGSTALTAGAGLAVFVPVSHAFGSGWEPTLGAAVLAVIAYALVELGLGVVLVTLLGERPRDALRHQLPLDALALPLAVVGAAAGLAALDVGWWLAVGVLLPVAFVPEIVFVVRPRRVRDRSLVVAATSAVLLVASLWATDSGALLLQVAALGVLAGVECRVARRAPFPLLGVSATIAAAIAVPPDVRAAAIPLTLLVAVGSAWWSATPEGPRLRFEALCWSIPLFATAAFAAALWVEWPDAGVVVFLVIVSFGLVVASAWGATPWRSRHVVVWVASRAGRVRMPLLVVTLTTTVVACAFALATGGDGWTYAATASVEIALGAAAVAVRQWRFAPRCRRRDGALLLGTSIAVVVAGTGGLGRVFLTGVVMVAGLVVVAVTRSLERVTRGAGSAASGRSLGTASDDRSTPRR